ncbi:MAG TPA: hypothetical protein DCM02_05790 [Flavobacterium sp.]|nr:hypothetical protein [Flavobacterium sp.]HAT76872.1 hypothetical protein [Flavobacterium sp.]HAT80877.1 hypothetical protein [Flavobacterium sp.]
MALENITEIEQSLGIENGKLLEMITSEESHSIDLSELFIEKKSIYDERISNIKRESVTMAIEIAVKEQRNALGLDFQGKTMDNLVNAIKTKVESESKIEPEERFKSLKTDFEKLQSNLIEKENEFNQFKTNIEKQNLLSEIKSDFTKHIPDNTLVSKSTIFTEAKEKGFSFEREDGKTVVKQNGEVLKDERTLSPLDIGTWVTNFSTPYLAKVEGGAGKGDDKAPPTAGSFEAFEKMAQKNGWNDSEKNTQMARMIKDGTLKV